MSSSKTLSAYEILGPLSRGANSFVYKVRDIKQNKLYALKVIDKMVKDTKIICTKKIESFRQEIKIHKKLDHPNIVKLIHSFEDEENFYMVLEYCKYGELYSYLSKHQKFDTRATKQLTHQMCAGLKYLHDNLIFHRDLKLGNVLLGDNRCLKICDFG